LPKGDKRGIFMHYRGPTGTWNIALRETFLNFEHRRETPIAQEEK